MDPVNTKHRELAFEFATALAKGDFTFAYKFYSETLQNECNSTYLKIEYEKMIEYGAGHVTYIEVMNEMIEWPTKQNNDIAWVYVAMSGDEVSEAIAVVICDEKNQLKIREIEWGRP